MPASYGTRLRESYRYNCFCSKCIKLHPQDRQPYSRTQLRRHYAGDGLTVAWRDADYRVCSGDGHATLLTVSAPRGAIFPEQARVEAHLSDINAFCGRNFLSVWLTEESTVDGGTKSRISIAAEILAHYLSNRNHNFKDFQLLLTKVLLQLRTPSLPKTLRLFLCAIDQLLPPYMRLDVCINSCLVYVGKYKGLRACPFCRHQRFDVNGRPFWEIFYLPLLPRIRLMYANDCLRQLVWQRLTEPPSEIVSGITDTPNFRQATMAAIQAGRLPIALRLSFDGLQPFGMHAANQTYTVYGMMNLVLPPPVRNHPFFTNLLLIVPPKPHRYKPPSFRKIPGARAPNRSQIFISLILEELRTLPTQSVYMFDQKSSGQFVHPELDFLCFCADYPALFKWLNPQLLEEFSCGSNVGRTGCVRCLVKRLDGLESGSPCYAGMGEMRSFEATLAHRQAYQKDPAATVRDFGISGESIALDSLGERFFFGNTIVHDSMHIFKNQKLVINLKTFCVFGHIRNCPSVVGKSHSIAEVLADNTTTGRLTTEEADSRNGRLMLALSDEAIHHCAIAYMELICPKPQYDLPSRSIFEAGACKKAHEFYSIVMHNILPFLFDVLLADGVPHGMHSDAALEAVANCCHLFANCDKYMPADVMESFLAESLPEIENSIERNCDTTMLKINFHQFRHLLRDLPRTGPVQSINQFCFERYIGMLAQFIAKKQDGVIAMLRAARQMEFLGNTAISRASPELAEVFARVSQHSASRAVKILNGNPVPDAVVSSNGLQLDGVDCRSLARYFGLDETSPSDVVREYLSQWRAANHCRRWRPNHLVHVNSGSRQSYQRSSFVEVFPEVTHPSPTFTPSSLPLPKLGQVMKYYFKPGTSEILVRVAMYADVQRFGRLSLSYCVSPSQKRFDIVPLSRVSVPLITALHRKKLYFVNRQQLRISSS